MASRVLSVVVACVFLCATLLVGCSPVANLPMPASLTGADPDLSEFANQRSTAFVPTPWESNPDALFRALGSAGTLFFGRQGVVLPVPSHDQAGTWLDGLTRATASEAAAPAESAMVRLQFIGANPGADVVGERQLAGVVNYFIGDDPAGWHANVPTYGGIAYRELYPGIELRYTGGESALKGTFTVTPGADPAGIRWRYEGASRVELNNGELLIWVPGGGESPLLVERAPVAWQTADGSRVPVEIGYAIQEDASIGFAVGDYDPGQTLTIDPTLDYHTYFGGSSRDGAAGVAVDCNGYMYVAGATESADFPDPGTIKGGTDIFVSKFDFTKTGASQLLYTTYVGGSQKEQTLGIAVDRSAGCSGKAYVTGYTESDDFMVTAANAYQTMRAGSADGFVVQLDATGAPHYSSYLGGSEFEELVQVALSEDGLMYIVGFTGSANFPMTPDAFQPTISDTNYNMDACVSVLDTTKSGNASLVYSTYYGGSKNDEGYAIDVSDGVIYFAGHSQSDNLVLKNSIQGTNKGGNTFGDAYLVRLDPSKAGNNQLLFATYLGGAEDEISGGLAIGPSGHVYWAGLTGSNDFPITSVSPAYGGGEWDAFLVRLDIAARNLVFSRFAGGSAEEGIRDIVLDRVGDAYVAGGTRSTDLPTIDPVQAAYKGGPKAPDGEYEYYGPGDMYVAKFDATGQMTFATYLGGNGAEAGVGIVLDRTGRLCVVGGTWSNDLATVAPFQNVSAGPPDAEIACIGDVAPPSGLYMPIVRK
jgi:hypothetical protein